MNLTDIYQETRRTIAMARAEGYNTTEIVVNVLQAKRDAEKDDGKFEGLVNIFANFGETKTTLPELLLELMEEGIVGLGETQEEMSE